MMYFLSPQGMKRLLTLTPMGMMTPMWILRGLPTVVSSGLMLIAMYALQMQTLMQILVQVTMDHVRILETPRDYDALRPRFTWLPTDIIKRTFKVTTQYAWMPLNTVLRKHFKSPNPVVNV
jgi:hypothetical protein